MSLKNRTPKSMVCLCVAFAVWRGRASRRRRWWRSPTSERRSGRCSLAPGGCGSAGCSSSSWTRSAAPPPGPVLTSQRSSASPSCSSSTSFSSKISLTEAFQHDLVLKYASDFRENSFFETHCLPFFQFILFIYLFTVYIQQIQTWL